MARYDFPGESDEYIRKREELLTAEIELKDQIERVAAMRRALPTGPRMPNYVFQEGPADLSHNEPEDFTEVLLADLFGDHDTLIVDHLMYGAGDHVEFFGLAGDLPCPMCSMWADGYDAIAPHVEQRAAFVAVAQAEIGTLRVWARRRGWHRLRLLSARNNTFNHDLGISGDDPNDSGGPGLSVFTRSSDGEIFHRYTIGGRYDFPRSIDLYTPVWNLFDLMPTGREDWYPGHAYMPGPA
jgi:predicted dithiol-disulfide oxidoreductase (DUF899 family)